MPDSTLLEEHLVTIEHLHRSAREVREQISRSVELIARARETLACVPTPVTDEPRQPSPSRTYGDVFAV